MDLMAGIEISEKSKFRELDDEYLQKQARIWLSEVLKRRLDDNQTISDILASGDLLFDVSYVLWKMLTEKDVGVEDLGIFNRTRKSKRHNGKYTPYSNVDAFLKMCQLMGLNGVDLFSPSDVVERKDARKVCLCIRSLSKKARSFDINVPDFDIVTCTVIMPTKLIGCIRKSLELSQCSSPCSDSYSSCIDSDPSSIKTKSTVSLESSYDLHSEESDDAESCLSVGYYRPSSKLLSDTGFLRKSDSSSPLESYSLSRNINLEEALAHLGACNHDMNVHDFGVDDPGPCSVLFGSVLNPMPGLVNTCSKVCDTGRRTSFYPDQLEPEMNIEETNKYISCPDYHQCNASGSKDHLSAHLTSVYGDDEAKSVYELDEWLADDDDLENVHLSIIERFLTTTLCAEPKENFNGDAEKCDESGHWNLEFDVNDPDLKPILPSSSCEQILYFVDDGSSGDSKFVKELSLVGADEDKRLTRFSDCQHQGNFVEGTKRTIYGNDSPYEQEVSDMVLIKGLETLNVGQDMTECLEATSIQTEVLVLENHAVDKLNQSKTCKSPLLKSIMGGAAVLGVLAVFFSTRISDKPKSKKPDLEQSHISRENKLSSKTTKNGVTKKGVYAAGKLKFT